jgi:hypothetical protein
MYVAHFTNFSIGEAKHLNHRKVLEEIKAFKLSLEQRRWALGKNEGWPRIYKSKQEY